MLSRETVLARAGGLHAARVGDDELVLLREGGEEYLGLEGPALAVWDLLERPRSVAEIAAELAGRYDAPAGEIERDVLDFAAELVAERVLEKAG